MAIVDISDELKQLKKFEVKCKTCGLVSKYNNKI